MVNLVFHLVLPAFDLRVNVVQFLLDRVVVHGAGGQGGARLFHQHALAALGLAVSFQGLLQRLHQSVALGAGLHAGGESVPDLVGVVVQGGPELILVELQGAQAVGIVDGDARLPEGRAMLPGHGDGGGHALVEGGQVPVSEEDALLGLLRPVLDETLGLALFLFGGQGLVISAVGPLGGQGGIGLLDLLGHGVVIFHHLLDRVHDLVRVGAGLEGDGLGASVPDGRFVYGGADLHSLGRVLIKPEAALGVYPGVDLLPRAVGKLPEKGQLIVRAVFSYDRLSGFPVGEQQLVPALFGTEPLAAHREHGIPVLIHGGVFLILDVSLFIRFIAEGPLEVDGHSVHIHLVGAPGNLSQGGAVDRSLEDGVLALGIGPLPVVVIGAGGSEELAGQALEADLAGRSGVLRGKGQLVGELGIGHLHSAVAVAVHGVEDRAQGGVLIELPHFLAVDLKGIELLSVGVLGQQPDGIPLGVLRLRIGFFQLPKVLAREQLAQGFVGVQVTGDPVALTEAQYLALGGPDGEGRALGGLKLELDARPAAVFVAHFQRALAKGLVDVLLEFGDKRRVPVRASELLVQVVLPGQLNGLGLSIQGDLHAASPGGQVLQGGHLRGVQRIAGEGQGLDLFLVLRTGVFSAQQVILHGARGAADVDAVFLRVRKGDLAVLDLGPDHIFQQFLARVSLGADGDALALQLLIDLRRQFLGVRVGLGLVELDAQVAGGVGPAVSQGQGAVQVADLNFLVQVQGSGGRGGDLILAKGGGGLIQRRAAELVSGGGGQLQHPVDAHVAAGPAGGGHHVLVGALGDGLYRLVKEAGGHKVVGRAVRGVLREEGRHLVDHAPVGLLLPLRFCPFLAQG